MTDSGFLTSTEGFLTSLEGFLASLEGFLDSLGFLASLEGFLASASGFLTSLAETFSTSFLSLESFSSSDSSCSSSELTETFRPLKDLPSKGIFLAFLTKAEGLVPRGVNLANIDRCFRDTLDC